MAHLGGQLRHEFAHFIGESGITLKMVVVVVAFVLFHHDVPLGAHRFDIQLVHGVEIGGVKARAEHGVAHGFGIGIGGVFNRADQQFNMVKVKGGSLGHGLLLDSILKRCGVNMQAGKR